MGGTIQKKESAQIVVTVKLAKCFNLFFSFTFYQLPSLPLSVRGLLDNIVVAREVPFIGDNSLKSIY